MSLDNTLYYGDNLDILKKYIPDNSIDLIYLDPPFNSKATYNILYKESSGKYSDAQVAAFEDTWHWTEKAEATYNEIVYGTAAPADVIKMITAFRSFIGSNDMMAYLTMMCIRLIELRRVLKDTGSIYLHCDPTASHYLKIVMDTIFEVRNFRNEIAWCYTRPSNIKSRYPRVHHIIFFYTKSDKWVFNRDPIRIPYNPESEARSLRGPGEKSVMGIKGYDRLHPMGKIPEDWWLIPELQGNALERLGYPTQKPEALLDRIIQASSNEGDVVLDPFCGCGTTIASAQKLKRNWIGIDITHLSINIIKLRLKSMFGIEPKKNYKVIGEPEDLASAIELANQNRYQFQWWATSLIEAKPYGDKKKGKDTGIDGFIFFMDKDNKVKNGIVSVKSGKIQPKDIRELGYILEREKSEIGIFITLQEPSRDMITDAVSAGFYRSQLSGKDYPRIQILTIEELLKGTKPQIPNQISPFKKAEPNEGIQFDLVDTERI